jgi:hypothetical protein
MRHLKRLRTRADSSTIRVVWPARARVIICAVWRSDALARRSNNYGTQAGGVVTSAYAPDTPIDNLFLRHEPRYSHYATFFRALNEYASTLLDSPLAPTVTLTCEPTPGPTPPPSPSASPTLAVSHCSDDDPAHIGVLDVTQRFSFTSLGQLRHTDANGRSWCLALDARTASSAAGRGMPLAPCNDHAADQTVWTYNASTRHVMSMVVRPCKRPHVLGECHQCLDLKGGSTSVDLWDCKAASDPSPSNQQFDARLKAAEHGLVASASGLCLSASPPSATAAPQAHDYGGLAFLSNPADDDGEVVGGPACTVSYRGRRYELPAHTVLLVDTQTGAVVYNTSDVPPAPPAQPPSEAVPSGWQYWQEPAGGVECVRARSAAAPLEQMGVTEDATDYMWYVANVSAASLAAAAPAAIDVSTLGGSIAYASLTGSELRVLSAAMGMSNGGVGPATLKGVESVRVNGVPVGGPWRHAWVSRAESTSSSQQLPWAPVVGRQQDELEHTWFRAHVDLPAVPPNATQTAYALDLSTMNKGVAYVNGWHLGRSVSTPGPHAYAAAALVASHRATLLTRPRPPCTVHCTAGTGSCRASAVAHALRRSRTGTATSIGANATSRRRRSTTCRTRCSCARGMRYFSLRRRPDPCRRVI